MNEEYLKREDGKWIKKTTHEEVVDLSDNKLSSEIAYCDVQIMQAQKIIEEWTAKKTSLLSVKTALSEKPLDQELSIQIEAKQEKSQKTENQPGMSDQASLKNRN